MNIFGVDIADIGKANVDAAIDRFLREPTFNQIATVNPEFLLEAERNTEFRDVLNRCDLRVIDGFGVVLAGLFHGVRLHRYPGADLMTDLLAKAEREHLSVFFAVKKGGLSSYDDVARAVRKKYPKMIFSGKDIACHSEPRPRDSLQRVGQGVCESRNPDAQWEISRQARDDMSRSFILLCNFGAPEQELFLAKLRSAGTDVRLGIGVGGAFDFLTGKRKRAPKMMRVMGLEWLWRLIISVFSCRRTTVIVYPKSKRMFRIWNATAVFLSKSVFKK